MKHLVIYSSQTGNTERVAKAVFDAIDGDKHLAKVQDAPDPDDFDWIWAGFWLMGGKPDPKMQQFLPKVGNRRLFLFATHGAAAGSQHAKVAMDLAKGLAPQAVLVGMFSCQGEVQPKVLEKARAKEPPPAWLQDAPSAQGHPTKQDLEAVQRLVRSLLA